MTLTTGFAAAFASAPGAEAETGHPRAAGDGATQHAALQLSTPSPFPIDSTAVTLRSRRIEIRAPLDVDSMLEVTVIDSLENPTTEEIRLALGLLSFPPTEADSQFVRAAPLLRWNERAVPIAMETPPPRDWRWRFGRSFARLPIAHLKVAPGRGVLRLQAKVRWSTSIAYGRLEQQVLCVDLAGLDEWVGRPMRVDVQVVPTPIDHWLDYVETVRARRRAIQTIPMAATVDASGVAWHFEEWPPEKTLRAGDPRLLLLLEPNELLR